MSEQNKDIVRRAVDAFCRGDYPGIFAEAADDVSFTLMGQTGLSGTISGKAEVVSLFERALGQGLEAPIQMTIDNLVAEGDYVVEQARGKARTKTGVDYNNSYCRVWTIRDGVVRSCQEYLDTELMAKAFAR